jgi:hypothetical protein
MEPGHAQRRGCRAESPEVMASVPREQDTKNALNHNRANHHLAKRSLLSTRSNYNASIAEIHRN